MSTQYPRILKKQGEKLADLPMANSQSLADCRTADFESDTHIPIATDALERSTRFHQRSAHIDTL